MSIPTYLSIEHKMGGIVKMISTEIHERELTFFIKTIYQKFDRELYKKMLTLGNSFRVRITDNVFNTGKSLDIIGVNEMILPLVDHPVTEVNKLLQHVSKIGPFCSIWLTANDLFSIRTSISEPRFTKDFVCDKIRIYRRSDGLIVEI